MTIRRFWNNWSGRGSNKYVRHSILVPLSVSIWVIAMAVGCDQQKPGAPAVSSPPPVATQQPGRAPSASARPTPADVAASTRACIPARDLQAEPRRVHDVKPDFSDLRGVRPHAGALVFNVTISPTGSVSDASPVKAVDPERPWPIIAERWQAAILHWRYEPSTVMNKPVAVCLTVLVNVHVE